MKNIAPGLEKVSELIASKTGSKSSSRPLMKDKKKKKHLKFNFMKKGMNNA